MATLNGGITSTAELIRVSGTPPPAGSYVTIDSEALRINGAARGANGRSFSRDYLAVDRGIAGTTKATHSNGATLTQYYPDAKATASGGSISATDGATTVDPATSIHFPPGSVTDLGAGAAGVGLVSYLAGPYPIAFDTPNLVNPAGEGIVLDTFPSGSFITRIVVIVGVSFTIGGGSVDAITQFGLGDPTDWDNTASSVFGTRLLSNASGVGEEARVDLSGSTPLPSFVEAALLTAPYNGFGLSITASGTPDQGTADIYVIIATPAS